MSRIPGVRFTPSLAAGICERCRIMPTLGNDALCSVCRTSVNRRQRQDIWFRWLIASGIEALLGLVVGFLFVLPLVHQFTPNAQPALFPLDWLIAVGCTAALVGGIQATLLQPWMRQRASWALAGAGGVIASWGIMLLMILWLSAGALPIAGAIEALVSVGVASIQARLLQQQQYDGRTWLWGSVVAWIVGASSGYWIESNYGDLIMGMIVGVATSHCLYGAISGIALAKALTSADAVTTAVTK